MELVGIAFDGLPVVIALVGCHQFLRGVIQLLGVLAHELQQLLRPAQELDLPRHCDRLALREDLSR